VEPLVWIIVLLLLIIVLQVLAQRSSKPVEYRYTQRAALFTAAERSFYGVLSSSVEKPFVVFAKVRVADILTPEKGLASNIRQGAFNKISSKHFDFVLCRDDDLSVVCAIELNDRSHDSMKRQQRDRFLANAYESANLPLIQIPAKRAYSKSDILEHLRSAITS